MSSTLHLPVLQEFGDEIICITNLYPNLTGHLFGLLLVAMMVKNLCAVQETQIESLGQEDPLEKGMATHSCILAWRIPGTEKNGWLSLWGSKQCNTAEWLTLSQAFR